MRKQLKTYLAMPLALLVLCAALSLGAVNATAQGQGASSAGEAAALVKSRSGARVLGVRTQGQGPRTVYRVKIITPEGVVRVVTVPHRQR